MKAITITREYGAGGSELAESLGEVLGWQVLDRELLHRAAQIEHVPDTELDRLDEKAASIADRFRLHPPHQKYLHGLTEAARQAVQQGDVVLVGRGARHLLGDMPDVFHLRLVAPRPGGRSGWPDARGGRRVRPRRGAWKWIAAANCSRSIFGDVAAAGSI